MGEGPQSVTRKHVNNVMTSDLKYENTQVGIACKQDNKVHKNMYFYPSDIGYFLH